MHTPGPWWTGSDEDAHMVYSGNASTVEAVADCGRDDGDAHAEEANARLIAAAPDLLMALKRLLLARDAVPESSFIPAELNVAWHWEAAQAAINKATTANQ